jgi:hypothetical protein
MLQAGCVLGCLWLEENDPALLKLAMESCLTIALRTDGLDMGQIVSGLVRIMSHPTVGAAACDVAERLIWVGHEDLSEFLRLDLRDHGRGNAEGKNGWLDRRAPV